MTEPLYDVDGDRYLPTAHTRGPWDSGAQHGGPVAALLARAIESLPSDAPMRVARLTVELLRPVPLTPSTVSAQIERGGRRVQLVSASLAGPGGELCRATAWRIRELPEPMDVPAGDAPPFAGPLAGTVFPAESDEPAYHRTGCELRFVRGSFMEVGPSTVWVRLRRPVVAGEQPSPLMRVVAAADFGNGVSAAVEWGRHLFINTELTVHLHREPADEWVCLDAATAVDARGIGVAECALYDVRGRIGRSAQALLVERMA